MTKAMLTDENDRLTQEVKALTFEVSRLQALSNTWTDAATLIEEKNALQAHIATLEAKIAAIPTPRTTTRVAINAGNPVFDGLIKVTPFTKSVCSEHGKYTANKAGCCPNCSNAHIKAQALGQVQGVVATA